MPIVKIRHAPHWGGRSPLATLWRFGVRAMLRLWPPDLDLLRAPSTAPRPAGLASWARRELQTAVRQTGRLSAEALHLHTEPSLDPTCPPAAQSLLSAQTQEAPRQAAPASRPTHIPPHPRPPATPRRTRTFSPLTSWRASSKFMQRKTMSGFSSASLQTCNGRWSGFQTGAGGEPHAS